VTDSLLHLRDYLGKRVRLTSHSGAEWIGTLDGIVDDPSVILSMNGHRVTLSQSALRDIHEEPLGPPTREELFADG
jgi:hypothetical protein